MLRRGWFSRSLTFEMSNRLAILATLSAIMSYCVVGAPSSTNLEPRAATEPTNELLARTVPEIVSSCIITLILCASYCIRPNLSAPNAPTFQVLMRKLNVVFWAVLAPELVIFWAYKQWYYAKEFAKKYKDRGWTISHGQFVIMGGFILYQNDCPLQVLSSDTFSRLLSAGCIDFPSITEQDIKTKSKAHPLLAAVTLLQATWFIIQCIARAVRGLDIAQLEMITIVLIVVNASLLPAWWHKPLDARSFVRVDAKLLPSSPDALRILHDEATDRMHRDFVRQNYLEGNYSQVLWNLEVPLQSKHDFGISPSKIKPFALKLFTDYEQLYTSLGSRIHRGEVQVPIFHAPSKDRSYLFAKTILGFLFSSPYLAMWICDFPSPYHEKLWHAASVISLTFSTLCTTCCLLFCLFVIILGECFPPGQRMVEMVIMLLLGPGALSATLIALVVTGSRIALIIEGFVCLKTLDTTVRLAVAWTNFIPHVT